MPSHEDSQGHFLPARFAQPWSTGFRYPPIPQAIRRLWQTGWDGGESSTPRRRISKCARAIAEFTSEFHQKRIRNSGLQPHPSPDGRPQSMSASLHLL